MMMLLIFLQLVILTFTFRIPSEANSLFINNGFNGVVIIIWFYVIFVYSSWWYTVMISFTSFNKVVIKNTS